MRLEVEPPVVVRARHGRTAAEDDAGVFVNFTRTGCLKIFVREVARRWRDRPATMDCVGKAPGLLF